MPLTVYHKADSYILGRARGGELRDRDGFGAADGDRGAGAQPHRQDRRLPRQPGRRQNDDQGTEQSHMTSAKVLLEPLLPFMHFHAKLYYYICILATSLPSLRTSHVNPPQGGRPRRTKAWREQGIHSG